MPATRIPSPTKRSIGWNQFQTDVLTLASKIKEQNQGVEFKGIMAVARGGMTPAVMLSHALDVRAMRMVNAVSYVGGPEESTPIALFNHPRSVEINGGAEWLIVDDISDTGETVKALRHWYPKAAFACVYVKPMGVSYCNYYTQMVPQDVWLQFPWELSSDAS